MPEKTPPDRGRLLVDALIVWITPDRSPRPAAPALEAPDTDCPADSLKLPRRVVNRCRARPFVAADLAGDATCHRPRQRVAATWSPTRLAGPAGGCRAVRPPQQPSRRTLYSAAPGGWLSH